MFVIILGFIAQTTTIFSSSLEKIVAVGLPSAEVFSLRIRVNGSICQTMFWFPVRKTISLCFIFFLPTHTTLG